jgi:hypothetical protein
MPTLLLVGLIMSEKLRNKLRICRESKLLRQFFERISDIEVLQYDVRSTGFARIESQLQEFTKISSIPSSRIPIESIVDVVEEWIRAIIVESKIQSPVYLRMSNYWTMGWTQVEVKDLEKSLVLIWQLDKSVQIVGCNCSSLLVFWEEEYYVESFIKLPQLIPDN